MIRKTILASVAALALTGAAHADSLSDRVEQIYNQQQLDALDRDLAAIDRHYDALDRAFQRDLEAQERAYDAAMTNWYDHATSVAQLDAYQAYFNGRGPLPPGAPPVPRFMEEHLYQLQIQYAREQALQNRGSR